MRTWNMLALIALLSTVAMLGCGRRIGVSRTALDKAVTGETVRQNNEFAFDLYGRLRTQDGNIFCSPYSVSSALAMTYAGARGQTAQQMSKVMHFPDAHEELDTVMLLLTKYFEGTETRGYDLTIANSLWGQKGYTFLADYIQLTRDFYGAGLQEVDYKGSPEDARKEINDWAAGETNKLIREVMPKGSVTSSTRLVLANAIYFKGRWSHQFQPNATHSAAFKQTPMKSASVPMMNQTARFKYMENDSLQVLDMPYAAEELSMLVFLPKKADGLAELEKNLTASNSTAWLDQLAEDEIVVTFPKFTMTWEADLAKTLGGMGMPSAFDEASADFSGMDGKKDLVLSAVRHKAFVEVEESGTKAAAATAVAVKGRDGGDEPKRKVFRADHPFVFMIRDTRTGSILFLGRVVKP